MTDETPTQPTAAKDAKRTDKLKLDLASVMRWAKGNPWVLLLLASGGGFGGQEIATAIGQNVQWWWIALGVAGFALMDVFARLLRRVDRLVDDIGDIKAGLARGAQKFEHLEGDVKSLRDWRHTVNNQLVTHKPRSDGRLKPRQP